MPTTATNRDIKSYFGQCVQCFSGNRRYRRFGVFRCCYLRSARRTTAAMSNRPRHRFGRHDSRSLIADAHLHVGGQHRIDESLSRLHVAVRFRQG